MKRIGLILIIIITSLCSVAQKKADNIIIITLDGFRWQEMFNGADAALINDTSFVSDTCGVKKLFWADSPQERREKLLPFFWSTIVRYGQLHGNRSFGSK